jgi:hypothetical protein
MIFHSDQWQNSNYDNFNHKTSKKSKMEENEGFQIRSEQILHFTKCIWSKMKVFCLWIFSNEMLSSLEMDLLL